MSKPETRKSILHVARERELAKFLATRGAQVHLTAPQALIDELLEKAPNAPWSRATAQGEIPESAKRVIVYSPDTEPALIASTRAAHPDLEVYGLMSHVIPALLTDRPLYNIAKLEALPVTTRFAVICTPRTGSTLLCDLLAAHGMGMPREHLRSPLSHVLKSPGIDKREILRRVMHLGAVKGVFGTKLISHFLSEAFGAREVGSAVQTLVAAGFKLIHLDRDPIDQAVSRFVASSSGVWHSHGELGDKQRQRIEATASDPVLMRECLDRVRQEEALVQQALAGIAPELILNVHYEQVASDTEGTARACAKFLGVELPNAPVDTSKLPTRLGGQVDTHDRLRAEFVAMNAPTPSSH
jgi:LPS sulfotransferase NodH